MKLGKSVTAQSGSIWVWQSYQLYRVPSGPELSIRSIFDPTGPTQPTRQIPDPRPDETTRGKIMSRPNGHNACGGKVEFENSRIANLCGSYIWNKTTQNNSKTNPKQCLLCYTIWNANANCPIFIILSQPLVAVYMSNIYYVTREKTAKKWQSEL